MIESIYVHALLSAAGYVKWDESDSHIEEQMTQDLGFSDEQFLWFTKEFEVVKYVEDPDSGFSATIFEYAGKRVVSFRGTEPVWPFSDLITDVYLALGLSSIAEFFDEGQTGEISNLFIEAGLVDSNGNLLVEDNSIDFVGHSLGGHLALMAAYKYPDLLNQASTFNGAGLKGWDEIWSNYIAGSISGGTLDASRVTNYFADKGVELTADDSLWFNRPGGRLPIFIEEEGGLKNHGIDKIVESISVYRVLALLDPNLDSTKGFRDIYQILDAISNQVDQSLEATIQKLGALLNSGLSSQANQIDIELFYREIESSEKNMLYKSWSMQPTLN